MRCTQLKQLSPKVLTLGVYSGYFADNQPEFYQPMSFLWKLRQTQETVSCRHQYRLLYHHSCYCCIPKLIWPVQKYHHTSCFVPADVLQHTRYVTERGKE